MTMGKYLKILEIKQQKHFSSPVNEPYYQLSDQNLSATTN